MHFARKAIAIAALALVGCPAQDQAAAGASGMQAVAGEGSGGSAGEGSAPPDLEGPFTSFEARPCPEGSTLTYESFGAPLFLNYCEGCHGAARGMGERQNAPLNVSFEDLETIRVNRALIWLRAGDQNTTMPPVGGPSAEVRRQLGEWLACGAPTRSDLD